MSLLNNKLFNLDVSFSPIIAEIQFKGEVNQESEQQKLVEVLDDLFQNPIEARLPNEQPVALPIENVFIRNMEWVSDNKIKIVWNLNLEGARDLAYVYNRAWADEAMKDKKDVVKKLPKSAYHVGKNILSRLTEKPTGNPKLDEGRQVILDGTIKNLKDGLSKQVTFRVNRTLEPWAEDHNAILI